MDEDYHEYEGESEEEVEELIDDLPMRVAPRVFLGSIDAARNTAALRDAGIAFTLALLSPVDHAAGNDVENVQIIEDGDLDAISRTELTLEDALDERLFVKLPQLLATLERLVREAESVDKSVLVHCVAGRSRSPVLVAAWLIVQAPRKFASAEHAVDVIRAVRPWIAINAHFRRELQLFHRVATLRADPPELLTRGEADALLLQTGALPCVDFGASLVPDILAGRKTITMRLESDVTDDVNSDLHSAVAHATVVATTEAIALSATRAPFALLRVDRVATARLADLAAADVAKSGFASAAHVLGVLRQFYPRVTETTPLLVLHFQCVAALGADNDSADE
ncbi:hypothetical protein PybrP1_001045 [[Pythium] brassicae (nom. inval.)]|nr:hypothetical protein PybrP1_001045 [[Pythium] brassicae (nom. inval.)]